ncbi:HlyD family efflux transporter periplasmic adaptor subunit [Rhodobacteraceae bacterium HSP-20]|uniref:HlyD family efflux transporter periplasmic adaptor subunit n=1 Tax=Paragemmobacter amnigenus TaxID=2852097 RepID=A0ABS6IZ67_9RHOB|nr:HlyD family efflux transporter periplasmic adaptor subunit [Rhodobacter amnigenus]MBU9696625.1 HlyD family efflux transporter periplasmic adaptor subunit [Rhodobacter amnigenus]MBV4387852.1 HlyD family efflux transporter periplasmic adaptor subunit [Rhodobacter amnigenus]
MRRLVPVAIAAATLGLLVWAFLPDVPVVETAPVTRGPLTVWIEAEGEARIREVVVVSAPITGLLQRIALHPGDRVQEGDSVARIGPVAPALLDARARAVAQAGAAAAAAAVTLARSQVEQAEAALDYARTEAERSRALFARAALSARMLDDAILAERTAAAAVASARANLSVRERERDSALAVLDGGMTGAAPPCCVDVTVPTGGRILRVVSEDAQVVQAGTPILEIGDLSDLQIVADVLSREAVNIAEGADATVTGWGGPDFTARVERVEPGARTKVSALGIEEQRVGVRLSLQDAPPPGLGHGFRVTVRITVWHGKDVRILPVAALFRDGADWATFEVIDGHAVLRKVKLGERTDSQAEVVSGIDDGAIVILHPDNAIEAGARVEMSPRLPATG